MATNTQQVYNDNTTGTGVGPAFYVGFGKEFATINEVLNYRSNKFNHNNQQTNDQLAAAIGLENNAVIKTMLGKPYFQDTRVGGNEAINCVWQFGVDDDIVHPVNRTHGHNGEGRVYSSTTQMNQQICWFTFGVPYFTPLARFYRGAFNQTLIELNNNGWSENIGSKITSIFGEAFVLLVALPLLPFKFLYEISKRNSNTYNIDRFYELRGRMQLYYTYVDSILAHWLVASGLYNNYDGRNLSASKDAIPDALKATGCSMWDIIRRRALNAGMIANGADLDHKDFDIALTDLGINPYQTDGSASKDGASDSGSMGDAAEIIKSFTNDGDLLSDQSFTDILNTGGSSTSAKNEDFVDQQTILSLINGSSGNGSGTGGSGGKEEDVIRAFDDRKATWKETFKASALGVTQYIGFRITKDVDASESFSNSTSPSEFAESYNAKVKETQTQFINKGLGGGQVHVFDGNQSAIGSFLNSVAEDVKGLFTGMMEGFKSIDIFGLTDLGSAVMKGAYIDIPEQYSGSDFNKSHSINLQLRAPYGDSVSIFQAIIVPLACILAGALPRAGGSNSYTQPFLCRIYCKGMFAVPMGIIESVSIKRGDSEFGWTYNNLPTAIDVSITIKDMSPIMYMPMSAGGLKNILGSDNAFNEYILTLAGVGLFDRISTISRFVRNIQYDAHMLRNKYFNPIYWAHNISSYEPIQFVSSFIPKTLISNN